MTGTQCKPKQQLQAFPKQLRFRFSVHSVQQRTFQTRARSPNRGDAESLVLRTYEPEGRECESLRARHSHNAVYLRHFVERLECR
jgi:hypothetical protein